MVSDTEVCNYADDTTIFACDSDANNVQYKLEADASRLSKWFVDNCMKLIMQSVILCCLEITRPEFQ